MTELVKMCDCREAPQRASRLRHWRRAGFTLIELLVVIAIAAILTMIAIPGFTDMIQRNRVSGEVNSFVGDLQYARSEAIKTGQTVSICPSSDGSSCLGTNAWQSGWIVFTDVNGNGAVDTSATPSANDNVLRKRAAWTGGDTFLPILPNATGTTVITYGRMGFATNLNGALASIKVTTTPANNNAVRCVVVSLIGHQAVQSLGGAQCT
ncbi:MAG TPA: Tfp pilus assembly protein FimT/FimU [Burkholderiaceae bacterium]|jgi:type IV fimbrial biogenesis protein FimT